MNLDWQKNIGVYRASARRRREHLERERQQRLARGWDIAHLAAGLLRDRFGVRQVAVFGSLAHSDRFHLRSDVDLAVWGLDEKDYLRAVAELTGLDSEITVDLVAVEQAPGTLSRRIKEEGTPL